MPNNSKTSSAVDRYWRNRSPRPDTPRSPLRNLRCQITPPPEAGGLAGQVFWREMGDTGPGIVFLHGAQAAGSPADSSQWLPVLECLGERVHAFALDLPGCGESVWQPPPTGKLPMPSIARQVAALEAWRQALRLERFWLVGQSLGAWVATAYALAHPGQALGVVLAAPEGVALRGEAGQLQARQQRAGQGSWARFGLRWGAKPSERAEIEAIKTFCREAPEMGALLYSRPPEAIAAEQVGDRLASLACPLWLLMGTADLAADDARAKAYASRAAHVQLETIVTETPDLLAAAPQAVADRLLSLVGA